MILSVVGRDVFHAIFGMQSLARSASSHHQQQRFSASFIVTAEGVASYLTGLPSGGGDKGWA